MRVGCPVRIIVAAAYAPGEKTPVHYTTGAHAFRPSMISATTQSENNFDDNFRPGGSNPISVLNISKIFGRSFA